VIELLIVFLQSKKAIGGAFCDFNNFVTPEKNVMVVTYTGF
jgi:hypothetical protein